MFFSYYFILLESLRACIIASKAVGRCFRLGGPNAEGARTVQVGPGMLPRKSFYF